MRIGLDTGGIPFPIASEFETRGCSVSIAGYGTDAESVGYLRKLPCGGFLGTGIGGMAWVEASLPKVLGDDNIDGLRVVDAQEALREMWSTALAYVEPVKAVVGERWASSRSSAIERDGRELDHARVKRLDVVRDFDGVDDMTVLLDGLAGVPRSSTAKVRRYADAASNKAETLRVGPKSAWTGTLYDKHAETRGLAAVGRLRYEARCRAEYLQGVAARNAVGTVIGEVRHVTQDRIDNIARDRFTASGFDREVASSDQFTARVLESDLTAQSKRALLGYIAARAQGIDLGMSRNTEAKYRKLAKQLGVALGSQPEGAVVLDLDEGFRRV